MFVNVRGPRHVRDPGLMDVDFSDLDSNLEASSRPLAPARAFFAIFPAPVKKFCCYDIGYPQKSPSRIIPKLPNILAISHSASA